MLHTHFLICFCTDGNVKLTVRATEAVRFPEAAGSLRTWLLWKIIFPVSTYILLFARTHKMMQLHIKPIIMKKPVRSVHGRKDP